MKPSRFNCHIIEQSIGMSEFLMGEKVWKAIDNNHYPYMTAVNTVSILTESKKYNGELRTRDVSDTPRFKQLIEQE